MTISLKFYTLPPVGGNLKSRRLKHLFSALVIGVIASILALTISEFQLFKSWGLKTYDFRMVTTRGDRAKPENVAIFYVDEPSLRYMEGQGVGWPWPRELYAGAVDFARRGGARAVVFDLFFSEDSVYGVADDETFAEGVRKGPPSYFVLFLSKNKAPADPREKVIIDKSRIPFDGQEVPWIPIEHSLISLPIEGLVEAATGFGNAQIPPDMDGVYRRVDLIESLNDIPIPSIAIKVASDLKGIKKISWPEESSLIFGDTKIPLDHDGRMMINYYGSTDTFPAYSLAEILLADHEIVLGKKPAIDPAVVKDKVVIIGIAAPGLYDMKSSPFSRTYPGAEVHATVIENLLTGDFIRPIGRIAIIAFTVFFGLIVALGLASLASSWGVGLWLIILTALLVFLKTFLFAKGIWMPIIAPFGALLAAAFGMILFKFLTEGRKKREIRRAFGQYLSPEVVKEIANDPEGLKLGGEQKEATVFFSDIADFTTISESTPPAELVEQLNEYFSKTTRIIHEHGGTLDKYIGDSIMAFWGAPLKVENHAARAVLSALDIQKTLAKGSKFVTRIGIHTGPIVVGNIGSDIRFNYTAIGDTVNLASRLEGLNKKFGTRIIISESTYGEAADDIEARRIGKVRVKGRSKPIGIFEPLGAKGDFGSLSSDDLRIFQEALTLFETARFEDADNIFVDLSKTKSDALSSSYSEFCKLYINNPPSDFDGVITFKTK